MTSRRRSRVLAALAAVLLAAPALAQEWRGKARVDGIVRNEKGEPIEGVKVILRWGKSDRGGPDLTTDKKGRWSIFGLANGSWDMDFEAHGYLPKKISVPLQERARNPSVEVQLEPAPQAAAPSSTELQVAGKKISKEAAEAIETGNAAMTAKNWPAAREAYLKALPELPDNAPLLQRIAAAYLADGKSAEALQYARQAAEKAPSGSTAWLMVAQIELQNGNLEAGRAALEKVPPEEIRDSQPYLNVGILLMNQKKPSEAEAAFTKAVEVKPELSEGYYYRGLARLQMKKNAEAKADLQKALDLAPDGPESKEIRELLQTIR